MVSMAACTEVIPSAFFAEVSSTTVMASSTTRPVASTRPKRVSWLSENPNASTRAKVPISATGIAIAGTRVAFQFCKKRNRISTTRITASRRELVTPLIDWLMKSVVS